MTLFPLLLRSRPQSDRRRNRLLVAAALLASVLAVAQIERADAAWGWSDGGFAQSTVTNCISLGPLFDHPIQEAGVSTYVGSLNDIDTAQPYPGQIYYIHTVVYGVGNPCSGSRAVPEFTLSLIHI